MSSSDFFRNLQPLFEAADLQKAGARAVKNIKDNERKKKEEEQKKPANVKESSVDLLRKYSDIVKEAEENDEIVDEDDDNDTESGEVDEAVRVFKGGSDNQAPAKGSSQTADYERKSLAQQVKQQRANNRQADPSNVRGTVGSTKGTASSQWARQDQPGTAYNNPRAYSNQK